MGVTSERISSHLAHPPRGYTAPTSNVRRAAYIGTFILAALAIHQIVSFVITWGQIRLDDLRYGRPRTMHIEGVVGHSDAENRPSHFIAMNLNRQVVVLELPGGDMSKVRSFPGPYLFGDNEALTPVTLTLHDIDHDNQTDLLIHVRNEHIAYLNKDGVFRLPTPDEQATLMKESVP